MTARPYLRPHDLALAGHISVQQVRNYEASGLLPPAQRSPSGYRLYTRQHLAALKTVKRLAPGYGWPCTSAIMQALHRGDLPAALVIIDERHGELARKRCQVEQTLSALRALAAGSPLEQVPAHPVRMRVGEAARQVGVRVSALHFWEQQGLLHPDREQYSRYRLYDWRQLQRLRVVALLRDAGYPFDTVRSVLDELATGQPERAIEAVEKRSEELTEVSWACLAALTFVHRYVGECGLRPPDAPGWSQDGAASVRGFQPAEADSFDV